MLQKNLVFRTDPAHSPILKAQTNAINADPDPDPAFHFYADTDPTSRPDADPVPTFQFYPDPINHFSPHFNPPMLQTEPLRLPSFYFNADPDPAFHFDANPDPSPQNDADPDSDPQHSLKACVCCQLAKAGYRFGPNGPDP